MRGRADDARSARDIGRLSRLTVAATAEARHTVSKSTTSPSEMSIIAVTAFSSPEDRRKALEAGCDAFVAKPVRREELYRVIDEQLEEGGHSLD